MNILIKLLVFILMHIIIISSIEAQPRKLDEALYSYASTTISEIETDIYKLTRYLVKNLDSDRDKAKVLFFWISQNIDYDLEAYYENVYFDDFQETLDRKRGICRNYSNLFKEMCTIAGLECYEISGYGKGYDFEKGVYFEQVNHSWNVLRIDSNYYLCDITWGSGVFENKDYGFEYVKRLNMRYFLQEPSKFLIDHLPSNPNWQLINHPIKMEDFIWNRYTSSKYVSQQLNTMDSEFLKKYRNLDSVDRNILDFESALEYYYSHYISELLGIYCYNNAYETSINANTKQAHVRAIAYYEKSINALNNIVISYPKYRDVIKNAQSGITYSEYQIGLY